METYITIEDLADYLKIAVQTIRRWVLNKEIPFHKVKKSIRFKVSEIEWWIENGAEHSSDTESKIENDGFPPDVISLDELREEEDAEESDNGDLE